MKITKHVIAAAVLAGLSTTYSARAQDTTTTTTTTTTPTVETTQASRDNDDTEYPLYHAQELDADLFASGSVGEETLEHFTGGRIRHNGLVGGGGGLTYYFLRYLGVGGDFDAEGRSHAFFDSAEGNIYARLPILETGLAPYIFGGGGYQFKELQRAFGQAGVGLEFRFCRHVGLFVDARYVMTARYSNYGVGRAGLRISF